MRQQPPEVAGGPAVAAFADAAAAWAPQGWSVVPLPAGGKIFPVAGFTGYQGADATVAQMAAWAASRPADNALLRLPEGVVGLDVDDYDGRCGGSTWKAHEQLYGAPAPTWAVSSRADGVSVTRLYRTSFRGPFRGELMGGHVDVIHRGHRYVLLPPSLHPSGRRYRLTAPDGGPCTQPPRPQDLPMLPEPWSEALAKRTARDRPTRAAGSERRDQAGAAAEQRSRELTQEQLGLAELARQLVASGEAKPRRDVAGLSLQDLAVFLGISAARARHLESGHLTAVRGNLLARYGDFLERATRPVR